MVNFCAKHSQSPVGHTGHVKVYRVTEFPLNLCTVLPEFQLDFSKTAAPPFVTPSSDELDIMTPLLTTDGV